MRRFASLILIFLISAGCGIARPKSYILKYEGFGGDAAAEDEWARVKEKFASGQTEASIQSIQLLRAKFPDHIYVHQMYQDAMIAGGKKKEVELEYLQLAEAQPTALHLTLLSRLQESPADGLANAMKAIDRDDQFPWAWYARGFWEAKGSEPKNANVWFRHALDLHPDFFPAMRAYAILLRDSDATEAVDAIKQYVRRYPGRREERLFLASLRQNIEQIEEAEEEFRKLADEKPGDAQAWLGLAKAILTKNVTPQPEDVSAAKQIYQRLLIEHPDDPTPEFNLAVVADKCENDKEAAILHFKRYLSRAEGQPFLYQTRARVRLQELEAVDAETESGSANVVTIRKLII
ncbi:MAG: hypothetical protein ACKVS6_09105 [Planctomycetota bacterium]